jgi:hypothetical protein
MNRGALLPFILAVALGMAGGLYYSWVINPVEYIDTAPASLREDYKSDYLALIASAYASSSDLTRARVRLAAIPDPNPAGTLSQLAQTRLAQGKPESEARALALLAAALGEQPTPQTSATAHTETPSPFPTGPTPTPTFTRPPPATHTATATPGAPFELLEKEKVCDSDFPAPLIQIEVIDAAGRPVPGVEIKVVWDTGQDHFFTGLKPELGGGYADFTMTAGVFYTLQLVESETPVTGLISEECIEDEGVSFPGSWRLTFQQPAPSE